MAAESSRSRRERAEQMRKEKERQDKRRRTLITAAVVAAVLIVIAGAGFAVKSVMDDSAGDEVRTPKGLTKDGGVLVTAEDLGGTAQPDPVKLTIFEDLQCPVCKAFEETSGGWIDEQVAAGAIEVEYRPVAFLNEFSGAALAASMCVFEEAGAKGWVDYTRTVYQNQPDETSTDVDEDQLVEWADQVGAGAATDCIKGRPFREWAGNPPGSTSEVTDEAFASKDSEGQQVSGTPTVWVDGTAVTGSGGNIPTPADLEAAVTAAKAG
ncbi:DsbA family protein [Mumia sp. zg.B53]|uniref:DsbA family protein n=1 Tax=unclassified Mumia TaxID=2621872 RepID=UPI001C6E6F1C|nr:MULTISPECIES: thioredoxin domain-containing protein [unclassified Mumia]MBW9205719.1 DsbA family protein [Mumia sp. zg.B17]MBW9208280.1 DsbA family protein [Mumia sp. zg.B21]MBW9216237.1 DsbA family protein [Mumia sp. zg.B53]MDD9348747.1 thioredoxin domain-containing protein [Mumia sp.]